MLTGEKLRDAAHALFLEKRAEATSSYKGSFSSKPLKIVLNFDKSCNYPYVVVETADGETYGAYPEEKWKEYLDSVSNGAAVEITQVDWDKMRSG